MPFRPFDAAAHAITRARATLEASEQEGLSAPVKDDMRRFSVVLAVAALDTYMHRLVMDRAFGHSKLPARLAETSIPFERLLTEADASAIAARSKPFNSRPKARVRTALRDQLLKKTFQSPAEVDEALGMAGLSGNWSSIGKAMGMTKKQVERRLSKIVMRRNWIVHEGDYERRDRPQGAKMNPLSQTQVADDIDFLARFTTAINSIT